MQACTTLLSDAAIVLRQSHAKKNNTPSERKRGHDQQGLRTGTPRARQPAGTAGAGTWECDTGAVHAGGGKPQDLLKSAVRRGRLNSRAGVPSIERAGAPCCGRSVRRASVRRALAVSAINFSSFSALAINRIINGKHKCGAMQTGACPSYHMDAIPKP